MALGGGEEIKCIKKKPDVEENLTKTFLTGSITVFQQI